MANHARIRIGLICILIVQALSLTGPSVASAGTHEPAQPRTIEPSPAEHPRSTIPLHPMTVRTVSVRLSDKRTEDVLLTH